MKVSSTEFQQHVGKYLDNLEKNKTNEILITRHGKPTFKIIPLNKPNKTNTDELLELLKDIPGTVALNDNDIEEAKLQRMKDYESLT